MAGSSKKKGVHKNRSRRLVFVSHSGEDTWVAKQIAREIENCGAKSFLDEAHISVGDDIEERLRQALLQADELVMLLTPWALDRPYVWAEVGSAWTPGLPIIGLVLGITVSEVLARPAVPGFLKKRLLLPLNQINTYLDQLRDRVQTGTTDNREANR